MPADPLALMLRNHVALSDTERADLDALRTMVTNERDPWSRATAMHLTASALVVHRPSRRVLLRWHERQQAWIQVGGHGDPGEFDPLEIAMREGLEETGLTDLVAVQESPIQLVIVSVPANEHEGAHRHGDIRYVLSTDSPDDIRPESSGAPLRWLSFDDAAELCSEANVREALRRTRHLLG